MRLIKLILLISFLLIQYTSVCAMHYGETLCNLSEYFCMKIKPGEHWSKLFPNPEERDIIRRVNRINIRLRPGMTIAVPKNLERISIYDVSPFPRYIEPTGQKTIYINQKKLAWGAYTQDGELVWWGPISSGMSKCKFGGNCHTPTGSFRIIRKQDIDCVSTVFPRSGYYLGGGALMPYCMHFLRGYALHGSPELPGYRASHGCVRLFIEDARWLNEEFIDLPGKEMKGTRVILNEADDQFEQSVFP